MNTRLQHVEAAKACSSEGGAAGLDLYLVIISIWCRGVEGEGGGGGGYNHMVQGGGGGGGGGMVWYG